MTTPVHPDTMRAHRDRKNWTQEELAKAAKVSLPTIKRIEGTKEGLYAANTKKAEAISKALAVDIAILGLAPAPEVDREAQLRKYGYRPLRTMIDGETALAFNMVQHIYGISTKSQIEMAPLFMALLAEGSLAWRRKRVTEVEEVAGRLMSLGRGHLSFAIAAYRAEDGAAAERKSIEMKDLFGEKVGDDAFELGYDPAENNPFADYLVELADEAQSRTITFGESIGWKTSEGFPHYRIGADLIAELTAGDPDAEYALIRGYVRLKNLPHDLLGSERDGERVAWMIAQIPEAERAERQAELEAFLAELGPDFLPDTGITTESGMGDQDA